MELSNQTLDRLRLALGEHDAPQVLSSIDALAQDPAAVSPVEAVDALERTAALGTPAALEALWNAFDGDFAYTGWALALALRCAASENARFLMARGVDLLGEVRVPRRRALLPHEGTFTRFDLTRESPTLFLNNMDPTVSTEVFEPFRSSERIAGPSWSAETSVGATCTCVLSLARDGLFDTMVFDDLFRAAMVKAWHALRSTRPQDQRDAQACLGLGRQMLALHREHDMGDATIELVLGNLMVPKAARPIIEFVCDNASDVFLNRLAALSWLQADIALVRAMVPRLAAGTEAQNGLLLRLLAQDGLMAELGHVATWPRTLTRTNLTAAIEAASAAGQAEAVTWLFARLSQDEKSVAPAPIPNAPAATAVLRAPRRAQTDAGTEATADDHLELALKVLDLTRQSLIADNPFLAAPLSLLVPQPVTGMRPARGAGQEAPFFSTNGRALAFDARGLLESFRTSRELPVHDLAHVLVHCILLHPFVGAKVNRPAWDLACDLVAQSLADELCGAQTSERGHKVRVVLEQVAADLGVGFTAERLYHALRGGAYQNSLGSWAEAARVDDHSAWYPQDDASAPQEGASGQSAEATAGDTDTDAPDARDALAPLSDAEREAAQAAWSQGAKSMRVELQTLSRSRGAKLAGLVRELEVTTHERVDYRDFLRQFAVRSEEPRLSDDEFDYVFYTYGLALYRDMPLIEPLEYRSEARIRDFVIVIDTSSSVTIEVVQQFVNTTFDVLTSESSFFGKTNIHIIQADARVQNDTKITSLAELDRWRRNIKLQGFGGTDFRPAFRYVSELLADGEFQDLSGLIYFTDGWGIYPSHIPPYKTTFVFYDEDHRPELVPAWAMQITLHPGEFQSMSVY